MLTAAFTPLEPTRKALERAHFSNIDLKMHDFEGDFNDLMFVAQAASQNLISGAASSEAKKEIAWELEGNRLEHVT